MTSYSLRHGAFCVSRQHRLCSWWAAHFHVLFVKGSCLTVFTIGESRAMSYSDDTEQLNKHNKWVEIFDFQPKLLWRTPTKIHRERRRRRQQEAAREAQKTSLNSTAKATSSTERPQTCTEAVTKYCNYTANGADEEREHRVATLQKAMGISGNAYSLQ